LALNTLVNLGEIIDEVFVRIAGKLYYLWRAVDQDGEVVDVFLQSKRDGLAAKRFFKRFLKSHKGEPRKIVTDKLRNANNRSELSHQPTRVRERVMRRFKSKSQAQRFLDTHASVYNLFNLGRHLISPSHYRSLRTSAFIEWNKAIA